MPKLKCGVDSCAYWHNQICIREGIQVKGDTALDIAETRCSSYRKREKEATDESYKMEIGILGPEVFNLEVKCEAQNCVFNKRLSCHAQDIKIDGSRARASRDTFCSSFHLK
ncbi:MAG: DUF1540 domain-containing protein [Bacilli bacterium]|nr:DUF1540 domain-containing protein [Bacilli bacterium]